MSTPSPEEAAMLNDELKILKGIEEIQHLEGVQSIVEDTKQMVVSTVNALASAHLERTEIELRGLCATLAANLTVYQKITGVSEQIAAIEKAMEP